MSKYVPYHAESAAYARKLAKGKAALKRYEAITGYVSRNFVYDYIRAIQIPKKGGLPDVKGCWQKKMGICLDIASMTTGMLRAAGLKAYLCIGPADRKYHAWVETVIDGQRYRYDHDGKAKVYKTERIY